MTNEKFTVLNDSCNVVGISFDPNFIATKYIKYMMLNSKANVFMELV